MYQSAIIDQGENQVSDSRMNKDTHIENDNMEDLKLYNQGVCVCLMVIHTSSD